MGSLSDAELRMLEYVAILSPIAPLEYILYEIFSQDSTMIVQPKPGRLPPPSQLPKGLQIDCLLLSRGEGGLQTLLLLT